MNRRHLLPVLVGLFFLFFSNDSYAQFIYKGFSGGMMLHTGYLSSSEFTIYNPDGTPLSKEQIKGAPFGIGGALRFHFGSQTNHLRVGLEGYRSSINYQPKGSTFTIGSGGLLIDYFRNNKGRFDPFIGLLIGGGGAKNLTLSKWHNEDYIIEQYSSYRKYPFLSLTPYIGFEIEITNKLRFIMKGDYLINISNKELDFARGVRFYAGIIFSRFKE